ncbi:MAG: putative quinol monooxygenase [Bacteroidota bacterium]|jgi:quinol monooxygenase YgiN
MIVRIVKMGFRPENVNRFLEVFEQSKAHIAAMPGCRSLSLLRDKNDPCLFFTHSEWEDEKYLEAYRKSAFFEEVWKQTKVLFSIRPEAWSTERQ